MSGMCKNGERVFVGLEGLLLLLSLLLLLRCCDYVFAGTILEENLAFDRGINKTPKR